MSKIKKIFDYNRISNYLSDQMIQAKITAGQKEYQKFIILSDYRSGSNFLMNLLKSHKNAHCYSELFFSRKIFWASAVYGKSENDKKALDSRKTNPYSFLDKYCYRPYKENLNAVGFKLMYHDLYRNQNIDLKKLLRHYPDMKVIHLKRKNLFERFVSQVMVGKTGEAVAVKNSNWESKSKKIGKLTVDPKVCEGDFEYRARMERELDEIINDKNLLTVYYEELNSDYSSAANKVLNFLNLERTQLKTNQIKQNKSHISNRIENYSELKTYFKESKWEGFFN